MSKQGRRHKAARVLTALGAGDKPSKVYAELALGVPVLHIFGAGVYIELEQELGGAEAVLRWALDLAARLSRPVLFNLPDGANRSRTFAIPPPDWTPDKTAGWVAGKHEELEDAFGPVAHVSRP